MGLLAFAFSAGGADSGLTHTLARATVQLEQKLLRLETGHAGGRILTIYLDG